MDRIAAALGGDAGDDGTEQDGKEGAALDQRVAGRQLRAREMVGQDAVFDRAEQRGDGPEQEHGEEQKSQRMESEAGDSDRGDGDLGELEPLRHQGLVVAVGELAAEAGQEKERGDQRRASERDQGFGIGARNLEQDDEDQRGLEEVVAECREELAPEQGRETSRGHQGRGHGSPRLLPRQLRPRQPSPAASLVGGTRLGDAESKAAPAQPRVVCGIKGIGPARLAWRRRI